MRNRTRNSSVVNGSGDKNEFRSRTLTEARASRIRQPLTRSWDGKRDETAVEDAAIEAREPHHKGKKTKEAKKGGKRDELSARVFSA
ncbi:uncharacterized protein GLRG_00265 [Colletotrichum graminicola M1.001]|uniref:Uncharacterized protein n=1 Tax=Colletotrichum graminicola (strain M1.001 / M2 / FGSC 10212) TaxID=645133 RepID=E3Q220_COLGM|nr:uncharacterized protein GLRG_00265 [Colletotrichum graminicola M1.001]EFQ25121.1 hypothetical protein GLRG_00265 [Colletotrichum graminicola M1.001]